MYEERREKFSFKGFFITILLVLLFVFLMLWLFPTKWDIKNLQSTHDLDNLSVLYDEIFANNVSRMKDAAVGYFTNERMPQKIGDSKKLTLQEMYNLGLVLKIRDRYGDDCDTKKSYVEITKDKDEYKLKVNLSCGTQEDFIIVYLGCYDYCDGLCEKRVETTTNTPAPQPQVTPTVKSKMYEYKLVTQSQESCTGWSEWTKNKIDSNSTTKVETKVEKEIVGYESAKVQVGTKTEVVTTGQKTEKYVVDYVTKLVVTETKKIQIGTTTEEVTEKVQVGTVEKYSGIGSGTTVPSNTATTIYKNVTVDTNGACSNCNNETIYTWEIWNVEPVYDVVTTTKTVPVYKIINIFEEQTVPVYDFRTVDVTEVRNVPVYKTKQQAVYEDVKYYRSNVCTVKEGSTYTEWSYNQLDYNLLNKGYYLTGNVKEV